MPKIAARPLAATALRFAVSGIANTAVGLIAVAAARYLLGLSEYVANAVGFVAGLAFGFAVNRLWTFEDRRGLGVAAPRYLLAFAASYFVNLTVLFVALRLELQADVAQAMAIVTYSAVFFVLCRRFVFPQHASSGS